MEFIWKLDLNPPQPNSQRDFFINELSQFLPQRKFIEQHAATTNFQYPFKNTSSREEEKPQPLASIWYRWSSQVIHSAYQNLSPDSICQTRTAKVKHNDSEVELNITIKNLFTRFTRYEGKRFIIVVLNVSCIDAPEANHLENIFELQKLTQQALHQLFGHLGTATYRVTDKFEEFKELMQIMNPAPLLPKEDMDQFRQGQHKDATWIDAPNYTRLTRKRYLTQEKYKDKHGNKIDQYIRERENLYFVDSNIIQPEHATPKPTDTNDIFIKRNRFIDRYHTEMLFFIRGEHYEKELSPLFTHVKFLNSVSKFMNSHWGRIRALYAITPKFAAFGNNASARIMFFLLELNAHYLALQTKIKYNFDSLDKRLDEQLERPMFNLEPESNDVERSYYDELKNSAKKSFDVYAEKRRQAQEFGELIDQNIQKLHGDFDSKSNMVLQSLVFIFSLIFVFWGAYEIWLDKVFTSINYTTLKEIWSFVMWSLGGLGVLFLIYLGISKFFLAATSFSFNKGAQKQIKKWMSRCQPEFDFGANSFMQKRCISTTEMATNQTELEATVMAKIKQSKNLSTAMETALQFVSLAIIGVATGQLDAAQTEIMLDEVNRELFDKKG
jgi:hypothetical protein